MSNWQKPLDAPTSFDEFKETANKITSDLASYISIAWPNPSPNELASILRALSKITGLLLKSQTKEAQVKGFDLVCNQILHELGVD